LRWSVVLLVVANRDASAGLSGGIVLGANKVRVAVPLSRPLTYPPLATPAGVRFTLTDRSKLVHCLITQAGLEKLVRQALTIGEFEMAFHEYRERIETTASRKYDASATFYRPFTITPVDLVAFDSPVPLRQPA
jgi:hypothetical protein